MRRSELDQGAASGNPDESKPAWRTLIANRTVLFLIPAVAAFHLANAPILWPAALQHLGFRATFVSFAVLALVAAGILQLFVPESRPAAAELVLRPSPAD
jgi:hypothetical protein